MMPINISAMVNRPEITAAWGEKGLNGEVVCISMHKPSRTL